MPNRDRPGLSRRAWLAAATGTAATGLVLTRMDAVKAAALQDPPAQLPDPTKVPGPLRLGGGPPRDRRTAAPPRTHPGAFELLADAAPGPARDDHSSDLHFERHHAGVPENPCGRTTNCSCTGWWIARWSSRMADLRRYPQVVAHLFHRVFRATAAAPTAAPACPPRSPPSSSTGCSAPASGPASCYPTILRRGRGEAGRELDPGRGRRRCRDGP